MKHLTAGMLMTGVPVVLVLTVLSAAVAAIPDYDYSRLVEQAATRLIKDLVAQSAECVPVVFAAFNYSTAMHRRPQHESLPLPSLLTMCGCYDRRLVDELRHFSHDVQQRVLYNTQHSQQHHQLLMTMYRQRFQSTPTVGDKRATLVDMLGAHLLNQTQSHHTDQTLVESLVLLLRSLAVSTDYSPQQPPPAVHWNANNVSAALGLCHSHGALLFVHAPCSLVAGSQIDHVIAYFGLLVQSQPQCATSYAHVLVAASAHASQLTSLHLTRLSAFVTPDATAQLHSQIIDAVKSCSRPRTGQQQSGRVLEQAVKAVAMLDAGAHMLTVVDPTHALMHSRDRALTQMWSVVTGLAVSRRIRCDVLVVGEGLPLPAAPSWSSMPGLYALARRTGGLYLDTGSSHAARLAVQPLIGTSMQSARTLLLDRWYPMGGLLQLSVVAAHVTNLHIVIRSTQPHAPPSLVSLSSSSSQPGLVCAAPQTDSTNSKSLFTVCSVHNVLDDSRVSLSIPVGSYVQVVAAASAQLPVLTLYQLPNQTTQGSPPEESTVNCVAALTATPTHCRDTYRPHLFRLKVGPYWVHNERVQWRVPSAARLRLLTADQQTVAGLAPSTQPLLLGVAVASLNLSSENVLNTELLAFYSSCQSSGQDDIQQLAYTVNSLKSPVDQIQLAPCADHQYRHVCVQQYNYERAMESAASQCATLMYGSAGPVAHSPLPQATAMHHIVADGVAEAQCYECACEQLWHRRYSISNVHGVKVLNNPSLYLDAVWFTLSDTELSVYGQCCLQSTNLTLIGALPERWTHTLHINVCAYYRSDWLLLWHRFESLAGGRLYWALGAAVLLLLLLPLLCLVGCRCCCRLAAPNKQRCSVVNVQQLDCPPHTFLTVGQKIGDPV